MCFSGPMAGFFATSSLVMAALSYRAGHPVRFAMGILYFGLMEALQAVQYLFVAVPEDEYKMCGNSTNQFLTLLGQWHIAFQPFFSSLCIAALARRKNIQIRYMNDIVLRLCFAAGVALACRYPVAIFWPDNPDMAPRPTEDCPNYEWILEGYDGYLKTDTPNLPGHSCTFLPDTPTGHLAWAFPGYQHTYLVPCVSLHFFLMFAPSLSHRPWIPVGLVAVATGPFLANYLTVSLNEQAAVWCFFSMFQCLALTVVALLVPPAEDIEVIEHPGGFGEQSLTYNLVKKAENGHSNGHSNGYTTNGHTNGHGNGYATNGHSNGKAKSY